MKITPAALAAKTLENFLAASTPRGIEAQEKSGQIEQSFLETLPLKGTHNRAEWEALGFKFGENADDLFVNATFPKGWRKKPTDHSMWSDLLDDKGRVRAKIFYKAAFYDRSAHIGLCQRFSVSRYEPAGEVKYRVAVMDAGKEMQSFGEYDQDNYAAGRTLGAEAEAWLEKSYPEWRSVNAYWD